MVSTSTTWRRPRSAVVLATALALGGLAACGDQDAGGSPVTSSSSDAVTPVPGPDAVAPAEQAVTVTVDDGSGATRTWTLTCAADGTPGGDHPDAAGACTALAASEDPFRPVPKDMMCTMIYGGPQTATVQGRWAGKDVLATFNRTDGCEISRWDRLAAVLQPGQPVSEGSGAM